MAEAKHLWEYDHPYYCSEGNFFKPGQHELWPSWSEFAADTVFVSGDRDQNLLIRWDWMSWRRHPDPDLRSDSPDDLLLFFVLQRKAILCSAGITVADDDEPAVRHFLEQCAKTTAAIWEPIGITAPGVTFMDAVAAGTATLDQVDDWVDDWHEGRRPTLRSVLGLTDSEYSRWVMNAASLEVIAAERQQRQENGDADA